MREPQRFPVRIVLPGFDAGDPDDDVILQLNGQADVVVYTSGNRFMNALARAYSIADAAYLQPFDHLKLPFNVGLGLVAFGYAPPGSLWLGAALIVGASFALLRQEARQQTA